MNINENIKVTGCITQEIYIKGKTLPEIERILGFQKGRLEKGMVVAMLTELPNVHQFDLLGYSQVAEHKFNRNATDGLDITKLKEMVLKDKFCLFGIKRLIKVLPNILHNDRMGNDIQYPPGQGVPQWKLKTKISARVVDIVGPNKVYR